MRKINMLGWSILCLFLLSCGGGGKSSSDGGSICVDGASSRCRDGGRYGDDKDGGFNSGDDSRQSAPYYIWSKSFGGESDDYVFQSLWDSSGNLYLAGYFKSDSIDFGGGPLINAGGFDIHLAKFDANGNHLWSRSFGGTNDDKALKMLFGHSDSFYIVGEFDSPSIDFDGTVLNNTYVSSAKQRSSYDVYVAKFDLDGNHLWSKSIVCPQNWNVKGSPAGNDSFFDVLVDNSDNFYIGGACTRYYNEDDLRFGYDAYFIKFAPDGSYLWHKDFGWVNDENVSEIVVDNFGNVYLAGDFNSYSINLGGVGDVLTREYKEDVYLAKFDVDGNHLWSKSFNHGDSSDYVADLFLDNSGNIYLHRLTSWGVGILTKFDPNNGNEVWTTAAYEARFLLDNLDNIYLIGVEISSETRSITGMYLTKFDPNGNELWSHSFSVTGIGIDLISTIDLFFDSSNNLYFVGDLSFNSIDFGGGPFINDAGWDDIYLAKFDPSGNLLWSHSLGGGSDDSFYSAILDRENNLYLSVKFDSSSVNLDGALLTDVGEDNIYLVKFNSNGDHLWSGSFGGDDWGKVSKFVIDSLNNVRLTGTFSSSSLNFGGGSMNNAGGSDIFLAKLGQ